MSEPARLFEPPPPTGNLTPRQLFAYEFVRDHPDGVSTDEVGAALHHRRGRHGPDARCKWCASEGQSVLLSLRSAKHGRLVKRRREMGDWVLRDARATDSPSPVTESGYDPTTAEIPY